MNLPDHAKLACDYLAQMHLLGFQVSTLPLRVQDLVHLLIFCLLHDALVKLNERIVLFKRLRVQVHRPLLLQVLLEPVSRIIPISLMTLAQDAPVRLDCIFEPVAESLRLLSYETISLRLIDFLRLRSDQFVADEFHSLVAEAALNQSLGMAVH